MVRANLTLRADLTRRRPMREEAPSISVLVLTRHRYHKRHIGWESFVLHRESSKSGHPRMPMHCPSLTHVCARPTRRTVMRASQCEREGRRRSHLVIILPSTVLHGIPAGPSCGMPSSRPSWPDIKASPSCMSICGTLRHWARPPIQIGRAHV